VKKWGEHPGWKLKNKHTKTVSVALQFHHVTYLKFLNIDVADNPFFNDVFLPLCAETSLER